MNADTISTRAPKPAHDYHKCVNPPALRKSVEHATCKKMERAKHSLNTCCSTPASNSTLEAQAEYWVEMGVSGNEVRAPPFLNKGPSLNIEEWGRPCRAANRACARLGACYREIEIAMAALGAG